MHPRGHCFFWSATRKIHQWALLGHSCLSFLYMEWTGKKEMLVKTNLCLVLSVYGTISVMRQSLYCQIAPPIHNPHFQMTPVSHSLSQSQISCQAKTSLSITLPATHHQNQLTATAFYSHIKKASLGWFVSPNWVPFRTCSLATNKLFSVTSGPNFIALLTTATC